MTWVTMSFLEHEAALLHSLVRESGWGYTEAGLPEVAAGILDLADSIRRARERSGTAEVKSPHHDRLFDAQFPDVDDRTMILGVDEPSGEEAVPLREDGVAYVNAPDYVNQLGFPAADEGTSEDHR